MDEVVRKCLNCASPLKEPRKLKDFCDYSCRGQHSVKALDGTKYQGAYLGSKNTRKTKALRRLKTASREGIAFERVNSITMRIDQPHKKAVGWLMEVAWPPAEKTKKQRWVACIGNLRSSPLPLQEAKEAARGQSKKAEPRDFIQELNQLAANEIDGVYWAKEKRKWPLDLMGGQRHKAKKPSTGTKLRQAILDTERVLIDEDKPKAAALPGDYPLEYRLSEAARVSQ
jgi:hypothetical protein